MPDNIKNSNAKVAMVVPLYNAEKTIVACVESLLAQTFGQLEIILVDDGSSDDGGCICDAFAAKDDRVVVVHQENKGRSAARLTGVEHATAEWVFFVDADDTIPPRAVAGLYAATSVGTDIILGNGNTLRGETRTTIPLDEFRHLAVRGEGTIGVPWGTLYRRSVLTSYLFDISKNIFMGEDYIFWLRLLFTTSRPVNIVYEKVYCKGSDTTSSVFVWTAEYARAIDELRKDAIPAELHAVFMNDMLDDRICNLMAVALHQPAHAWKNSCFYREILRDMETVGRKFTLRQRFFLSMPLWIRKAVIRIYRVVAG